MILTIIALGGSILGATTIAGLLVSYQIRQAWDLGASTRSIYAADAGMEWGLYKFFVGDAPPPVFKNGASVTVTCFDNATSSFDNATSSDCSNPEIDIIRAVGKFGNVNRAVELRLVYQ